MECWQANEECLNILCGMGINKAVAEQALYYTGNNSVEAAASFVFENPDVELDLVKEAVSSETSAERLHQASENKLQAGDEASSEEDDGVEGFKMVFVVNTSLKMGIGKLAAQVAHASLGIYREMAEDEKMLSDLNSWERIGEKKIVLKGENAEHLLELEKKAREHKVPSYVIRDAGRTQIAPNSITVLALFGLETAVNAITGKLSLL